MRRFIVVAIIGVISFGLSVPAAAQDGPKVGDSGPASGDFEGTDEACGFANFTDGYTATLSEDDRGVYIEFTQNSTPDTGQFRTDADGNITFETAGDEAYTDIDVQGDNLFTLYQYTSEGCTQEWIATVSFPPGFVEALIAGNAAPPVTEVPVTEVPVTEVPVTEVPVTEVPVTEEPETEEPGDDGGPDWALLGLLGLPLLALLWFLIRSRRPRMLYRADRGGDDVFIKEETTTTEPEVVSGPPAVIVDDGEVAPNAPPPLEGNCIPEREEFAMAQEAKDAAFAAGEQADRELATAKDEHGLLEATTRNPLGENPPEPEIDGTASESEQVRQQRVHELNVAEWQKLEHEATDAKGKLAAAKAALDKARADSNEAWQDFQRMRRRLEAARVALNNCDGSAGPADDDDQPTDVGEGSGGGEPGGETGGGSPGIIDEPTDTESDPDDEEEGCIDEAEKDGKVVSSTYFTVLGGDITVEVGTSAWQQAGNTFDAEGFADLDTSTVEELSAGIEQLPTAVRISVRIPTKIVTVKCIQILVCNDNQWVDSGNTRREVQETQGPDIHVLPTGAAGGIAKSKDRRHAGRMVEKAQAQLETLVENQENADDCECD